MKQIRLNETRQSKIDLNETNKMNGSNGYTMERMERSYAHKSHNARIHLETV